MYVVCGFFLLHIYRDLVMSLVILLWCVLWPCLGLQNLGVVFIVSAESGYIKVLTDHIFKSQ